MGRALPGTFWLQAGLGAALTATFYAWNVGNWFGGATGTATNVASILVPAGTAFVAIRRSRAASDVQRRAWLFLGLACLAWAFGQAAWTVYELAGIEVPTGSWADAGYLLFIPLAAVGLLSFSRAPAKGTARLRVVLDGIIIALSWLFIVWATALGALAEQAEMGFWATVITALYPLGDLVLATIVVYILPRTPAGTRTTLAIATVGLLALSWADSTFLYLTLEGTYQTGSPVDVGWIVGFQLIGLAAITPIQQQGAVELPSGSRASAVVPLVPLVLAIGVAVWVALRDDGLVGVLFWIAVVNVGTVTVRQVLMLFDNVALQEQTQRAVADLRAAQERRTFALNAIAHDLLNPLTPIRLQMRILRNRLPDMHPVERKGLEIIDRNTERVHHMASDLRDLANIEAGRLKVLVAPLDLVQVARGVVAAQQPVAAERGLRLDMEGLATIPAIADRGRVEQVLENLVNNALKFTPRGGRVTVRGMLVAGGPRIEVEDTGRGLAPEEMARLFQPFTQVHELGEAAERGSGLGLANGKAIVQQHGGRMGVASPGRGHGSTFWFELPVTPPANAGAILAPIPSVTPQGPAGPARDPAPTPTGADGPPGAPASAGPAAPPRRGPA